MFRKTGKNSEGPVKEESATYKYSSKKQEMFAEPPPRVFESPKPTFAEDLMKTSPLPFPNLMKDEVPETTLGEGVIFRGELAFERLLRIDGTFEGQLLSQGKVIVGPKGKVKANLNLREAIIEGKVEGNITVQERLELRGEAVVIGDIRAKSLSMDDGVTLLGLVRVNPKEELSPITSV